MAEASRYVVLGIRRVGTTCDVLEAIEEGPLGPRRVVMKRLRDPKDQAAIRGFFDECRIVGQLSHPGIVSLLNVGVEGQRPFQILELVEGMDARQLLEACSETSVGVPRDLALHIVAEVAMALDYAHNRPGLELVHRDITPENILISVDGRVRLTDFGIALFSERSTSTALGMTKGKLTYMSPEQALASHLDRRADIFSAGCVLHALLVGRSPLEDVDNQDRLLLKEPLVLSPELDSGSKVLLDKALAPDRRDRFQEARELAAACEAELSERQPQLMLRELIDKLATASASTRIVERPEVGFTLERTDRESTSYVGRTSSGKTLSEFLTFLTSRDFADEPPTIPPMEAPTVIAFGASEQTRTDPGLFVSEDTTESKTKPQLSDTLPNPLLVPPRARPAQPAPPSARRSKAVVTFGGVIALLGFGFIAVILLLDRPTPRDEPAPIQARPARPVALPAIAVPDEPTPAPDPVEPPSAKDPRPKPKRRRSPKPSKAKRVEAPQTEKIADEVSVNRKLRALVAEIKAAQGKLDPRVSSRLESDYLELGTAANRATTPEERAAIIERARALSSELRQAARTSPN